MRSLSREEVCRTFGLDEAVVDALVETGRLLCHVREGEVRIPLAQLEAFFREGLMNVYRAEVAGDLAPSAAASRTEPQPEPEPVDDEPAPAPAPAAITAADVPRPPVTEPRLPAAVPPAFADESDDDAVSVDARPEPPERPNTRVAPRYIPRRQIDGVFNNVRFSIVQISATGFRIRHNEELLPGDEARLSFALVNAAQSFLMRARVVWTSIAREREGDSRSFFISGLRVTEHQDRLARAIDLLLASHSLEPDRRAVARPTPSADVSTLSGVSDEDVAQVMKAVQRFATDPVEAARWQARARFALSDPQARRDAPKKPRERDEVLAIWEFLDRGVEVARIVDVVTWMRKTRSGATAEAN